MNEPNEPTAEVREFPTTKQMKDAAFTVLQGRVFDTLITYGEFAAALGLNPATDHRARAAVLHAGRRLLREAQQKIVNVKNEGYRIIKPNEHAAVSRNQQRRARRRLRDAIETATHVALQELNQEEVAQVVREQVSALMQLHVAKRLAKRKALPSREQLHLPSGRKLVEMMTTRRKTPTAASRKKDSGEGAESKPEPSDQVA